MCPLDGSCLVVSDPGPRVRVHCLRDLTRGGLASGLVEIAETARLAVEIDQRLVPRRDDVASACELLGLDPFHVANEGRFLAFVPADDADCAVAVLQAHEVSAGAARIGTVAAGPEGRVTCRGPIGGARVIDMLSGEQLPRDLLKRREGVPMLSSPPP